MDVFLVSSSMRFFGFSRASFCVDSQIVHVNGEPSLGYLFMEYGVHHHLEGCWGVSEPKEHDRWFEESFGCKEGCLWFVPWFDTYVVVPPSNVEFRKEHAST